LHTRKDARVAALDTHILKYMRDCGYEVPKSTPGSKKQYKKIEEQFLQLADESGQTVADFDLSIWKKYSKSLL
jgi:thermostable 8-oxoguanine DNA glycosylase